MATSIVESNKAIDGANGAVECFGNKRSRSALLVKVYYDISFVWYCVLISHYFGHGGSWED
jgi:hypothetical protein